jgi:hypothetical protein
MGWAFSPTMHYVYADRWTAALTPRVFGGPLLDSLQWDDTTWSQCLIRHRRDARPATLDSPVSWNLCAEAAGAAIASPQRTPALRGKVSDLGASKHRRAPACRCPLERSSVSRDC